MTVALQALAYREIRPGRFPPDLLFCRPPEPHSVAMRMFIKVKRLPHAEGLPLPAYATDGAAGMDLLAAVHDPVVIAAGERRLVPTGLTVALPPDHELQIRPRSGLALRNG